MPPENIDLEVLDWPTYGAASIELADQVSSSGFKPDIILAIARGGLFLAGSVGYRIEVKNISVVNVELYTGVNETLEVPVMLPPVLDKLNLKDMKVLICDDVVDSGKTLAMVNDFCTGVVSESRTAVLYQKPNSVAEADYFWRKTDKWIDFPWSSVGQ